MARRPATYRERTKNWVRRAVLSEAVDALTTKRSDSLLVRLAELDETLDFVSKTVADYFNDDVSETLRQQRNLWLHLHEAACRTKRARDLKVLYLSGPEPLNDLNVLIEKGISPFNVWAIESDKAVFSQALSEINTIPVKIHRGGLETFFEVNPTTFDLVYYDGCGPLLHGKPRSLAPIVSALIHNRLSPLSVLVTNFSEPPSGKVDVYLKTAAALFKTRYDRIPPGTSGDPAEFKYEAELLFEALQDNQESAYSELITHLISDLARGIIPTARALASPDVFDAHLASRNVVNEALKRKSLRRPDGLSDEEAVMWFLSNADFQLAPERYPLHDFLQSSKQLLGNSDAVDHLVGCQKIRGHAIRDLVKAGAVLLGKDLLDSDVASSELHAALAASWFDANKIFFCDIPFDHLLMSALLGVYGFPSFVNPRQSVRLAYKSRTNRMYLDMLVLDQARYFYEWFPTVSQVSARFKSFGFQLFARSLIDRIGWYDHGNESHPFRGSAVPCWGDTPSARGYFLPERVEIQC